MARRHLFSCVCYCGSSITCRRPPRTGRAGASGRADPGEEHVLAWQCRSPGRPYGRLRLRRLLLLLRRLLLWLRRQQR